MKNEEKLNKYANLPYSEFIDIHAFITDSEHELDRIKSADNLKRLFWNSELIVDLIEGSFLTSQHIEGMFNRINTNEELIFFSENNVLMRQALKKNVITLSDVAEKYLQVREQAKRQYGKYPSRYKLCNEDYFKYCILTKLTNVNDMTEVFEKLKDADELYVTSNMEFFNELLKNDIVDQYELARLFSSKKSNDSQRSQMSEYVYWANEKMSADQVENYRETLLSDKFLRLAFELSSGMYPARVFWREKLGLTALERGIIKFVEVVDKFIKASNEAKKKISRTPGLYQMIEVINNSGNPWKKVRERNILKSSDLSYLIGSLKYDEEYKKIFQNRNLVQLFVEHNLFDREFMKRCQKALSTDRIDFFNALMKCGVSKEEIQKLETVYHFNLTADEHKELTKFVELTQEIEEVDEQLEKLIAKKESLQKESKRRNEVLQNLIEYGLSSQYNLEQLKNLMTKDEKKKKIKLNL